MGYPELFCFQPERADVDFEHLFVVKAEPDGLRVKNKNVELLYYGLTKSQFERYYNYFNKFINFNFTPVEVAGRQHQLSLAKQEYLVQRTITDSLYLYAVNRLKVVLSPRKVSLASPFDTLLALLDKSYGVDTEESVALGANILRRSPQDFYTSVQHRRQYYNK